MDIQALIQAHRKHAIHQVVAGRTLSPYDIAKDARKAGVLAIRDRNVLIQYHEKHEMYFQAGTSKQIFEETTSCPSTPSPSPSLPSSS